MSSLVTIIMPFFNAQEFMKHALDSIIEQTYKNLEILCINDGSVDRTADILEEYRLKDKRIVVKTNPKNLGLIATLNNALEFVNGEFFARMDADDYSMPDRISKLVTFLNSNPDLQLVSSGYYYFREEGKYLSKVLPIARHYEALKILSVFSTPLTHAAVCGRTELIKQKQFYYDSKYLHAEDFELFSRLAWNGVKVANLSEPLYAVRLHNESVSFKNKSVQTETNIAIVKRNLEIYLKGSFNLNDEEIKIILCRNESLITFRKLKAAIILFSKIINSLLIKLDISKISEVKSFVDKHILNMIIQVNKSRLRNKTISDLFFVIKTLSLIKPQHYKIVVKKLF